MLGLSCQNLKRIQNSFGKEYSFRLSKKNQEYQIFDYNIKLATVRISIGLSCGPAQFGMSRAGFLPAHQGPVVPFGPF